MVRKGGNKVGSIDLRQIFGVDWYDGLLVTGAHLDHTDARAYRLLTHCLGACLDQPGLLWVEDGATSASGLISIKKHITTDGGCEIHFALDRPFLAVSASGSLIVAAENERSGPWGPDNEIHLSIAQRLKQANCELCICVCNDSKQHNAMDIANSAGTVLSVRKPVCVAIAVALDELKATILSGHSDYSSVARLKFEGDRPLLIPEFLPPVIRLGMVNLFDRELLPKVVDEYEALARLLSEIIDRGGAAYAQDRVDANFMSRRSDYESLRTMMLVSGGLVRESGRQSPYRLLNSVAQPLASWWLAHQRCHLSSATQLPPNHPIRRATIAAEQLLGLGLGDLSMGTADLLHNLRALLGGLLFALKTG